MHLRKNNVNTGICIFFLLMLATLILSALFIFQGWREDKLQVAMVEYEKCIQDEYKTTPTEYYLNHGEYPKCLE